jgi:hypothetical protein
MAERGGRRSAVPRVRRDHDFAHLIQVVLPDEQVPVRQDVDRAELGV